MLIICNLNAGQNEQKNPHFCIVETFCERRKMWKKDPIMFLASAENGILRVKGSWSHLANCFTGANVLVSRRSASLHT